VDCGFVLADASGYGALACLGVGLALGGRSGIGIIASCFRSFTGEANRSAASEPSF